MVLTYFVTVTRSVWCWFESFEWLLFSNS